MMATTMAIVLRRVRGDPKRNLVAMVVATTRIYTAGSVSVTSARQQDPQCLFMGTITLINAARSQNMNALNNLSGLWSGKGVTKEIRNLEKKFSGIKIMHLILGMNPIPVMT